MNFDIIVELLTCEFNEVSLSICAEMASAVFENDFTGPD